jgi:chemotaxis protein MotA
MLLIVGFLVVLGSVIGGFMMGGGNPLVLLQASEFVTIGGISLGILLVSSPASTLVSIVTKARNAVSGGGCNKDDFMDLMKLLYELFMLGRRNGLIALEDHMLDPEHSTLFEKYPSFLSDPGRVEFLCNGLKPLIAGRVKPEQLEGLLRAEVEAKEEEADRPINILLLIGDSLPGVGIIAAVLGIIETMSALQEGPAQVGAHVASALTGTFLGILGAYGFINPLATRIKVNNSNELQYYVCILKGVAGFANGMAPIMAVDVARRCIDIRLQPGAEELEGILKALNSTHSK